MSQKSLGNQVRFEHFDSKYCRIKILFDRVAVLFKGAEAGLVLPHALRSLSLGFDSCVSLEIERGKENLFSKKSKAVRWV